MKRIRKLRDVLNKKKCEPKNGHENTNLCQKKKKKKQIHSPYALFLFVYNITATTTTAINAIKPAQNKYFRLFDDAI